MEEMSELIFQSLQKKEAVSVEAVVVEAVSMEEDVGSVAAVVDVAETEAVIVLAEEVEGEEAAVEGEVMMTNYF